jgi:hypothetical protein
MKTRPRTYSRGPANVSRFRMMAEPEAPRNRAPQRSAGHP